MTGSILPAQASVPTLPKRIAAEALGSALLLATVVGSGIMAERLSAGNIALTLLANAIATGCVLYGLIMMFGPVSGAHFNSVVSVVMAWRRELLWRDLPFFLIAQILGAVAGVVLAHAMFDVPLFQQGIKARASAGLWVAEGVATFGLLLTILALQSQARAVVASAVALYITAAYWFTASTAFANPAVTIARSFTESFAGIRLADAPAFIAAQIIGALLAAMLSDWLFSENVS